METKSITIFEGADGSGKTRAAQRLAEATGAKYVHFGPLLSVKKGLARLYIEAALPALLGYQSVVFDRSWLSEVPYGRVFRNGADRLGPEVCRMLERIFMRCRTTVVYCDPGEESALATFRSRRGEEYLEKEEQLIQVRQLYSEMQTSLPLTLYDYTTEALDAMCLTRTTAHPIKSETAGNLLADTLIVGESYAERTDYDSWYQKPFCSFSGAGCSRWLTRQLIDAGISESQLLWCNADQLVEHSWLKTVQRVVALGVAASSATREIFGTTSAQLFELEHPQSHKRFNFHKPYPLKEIFT